MALNYLEEDECVQLKHINDTERTFYCSIDY